MTSAKVQDMKKAILVFETVLLVFALSGCESLRWALIDDYAESDKVAQQVITAIESEDEQSLIGLFSKNIISEVDDIEEGVNYTFDLYSGNCLEIEAKNCVVSNHYGDPGRRRWVDVLYEVTTTEGVYWLYFDYTLVDAADPEAEGIHYLYFYDDETMQKMTDEHLTEDGFDGGTLPYSAGIYHPGWDTKATKEE
jgi:hypothetical protein